MYTYKWVFFALRAASTIIIAGGRCWLYPKSLGAWHRFFQVLYNLLIKRYKIYIRNKTVQITYILRSERFAFDRVKIPGLRTLRVRSSENTGAGCERFAFVLLQFNFTSILSTLHFLLDFIFSLTSQSSLLLFTSIHFKKELFFFTLRFLVHFVF